MCGTGRRTVRAQAARGEGPRLGFTLIRGGHVEQGLQVSLLVMRQQFPSRGEGQVYRECRREGKGPEHAHLPWPAGLLGRILELQTREEEGLSQLTVWGLKSHRENRTINSPQKPACWSRRSIAAHMSHNFDTALRLQIQLLKCYATQLHDIMVLSFNGVLISNNFWDFLFFLNFVKVILYC